MKWNILSIRRRNMKMLVLVITIAMKVHAIELPQSRLAALGQDGKLTYSPYTDRGDRLPDFSWCGYRGGGVALPLVSIKVTLDPAEDGDDHTRIQQALDTVAAMPLDEKGFRGAVLLKRGKYRVGKQLNIEKSGIVLRGEGDGEDGTVLIASAATKYHVIVISGNGEQRELQESKQEILSGYVPVGSRTFKVKNPSAYKVGEGILVCREGNQEWIEAIGMKEVGTWKPFCLKFSRVIMGVTDDTVTVDAPIVNAIDNKWGGGYLVSYEFPGRIENVGVEAIRCDSIYASPTDHAHAWWFIKIMKAQNVWVRNCTALHLAYSAVEIKESAKWVTVLDTKCLDMISIIKGGLRYPFAIMGQLCLVQRCVAREGRHDFIMQAWVPGPNVFLDCRSENSYADSGTHQRYATGTLFDNVETEKLNVINRGDAGSGHGWAGAQMVFWNCKTRSMNVQQPPTAQNFAIGCVAEKTMGNGYRDSNGVAVSPQSLYLRQLEERLGPGAVKNIQP